jgi:hypothetical protein
MAMACFFFFTFWPELDFKVPTLNSFITLLTLPGRVVCLPIFPRPIAIIHTAFFCGSTYHPAAGIYAIRLLALEAFFW